MAELEVFFQSHQIDLGFPFLSFSFHHTQFSFFLFCNYSKFRLSYCPLRLSTFTNLLKSVFGEATRHEVFGDFEPLGQVECPAYYVHMIWKQASEDVNGAEDH